MEEASCPLNLLEQSKPRNGKERQISEKSLYCINEQDCKLEEPKTKSDQAKEIVPSQYCKQFPTLCNGRSMKENP
jgi:hypothetical protein